MSSSKGVKFLISDNVDEYDLSDTPDYENSKDGSSPYDQSNIEKSFHRKTDESKLTGQSLYTSEFKRYDDDEETISISHIGEKYGKKQPHSSYVNLSSLAKELNDMIVEDNDPYSRRNRAPPTKDLNNIDPQFIFKRRLNNSQTSLFSRMQTHNHSSLNNMQDKLDSTYIHKKKSQGSSLDLRRFFKTFKADSKKDKFVKTSGSSLSLNSANTSDLKTKKVSKSLAPFSEDHPKLTKKYGSPGKVLGTGAGGSVRIMHRKKDGKLFAVKQFRARAATESERDYTKKITAEFCIGSALHHPNIIESLDIFKNEEGYFEVMEYAPYDMFATVMTGEMSTNEIFCCFKQLLSATAYLHNYGLAHRDIKLDNLVLDEQGILKLIDFGSAIVFRYPFEKDNIKVSGIVGSDPYLAPEVFIAKDYNPAAVDIWSCAIVFCSMYLRKFPWKIPKVTDNSFRLFSMAPNSGENRLDSNGKPIITGPMRLLRLLPSEVQIVIGRMLLLNPAARATILDVLRDPWMNTVEMCLVQSDGSIYSCENHTHTLKAAD